MKLIKPDQAVVACAANSATAPFIYADGVLACGSSAGEVQIELAANTIVADGAGSYRYEVVVTAHLRCTRTAALAIRQAIDEALNLTENTEMLFAMNVGEPPAVPN